MKIGFVVDDTLDKTDGVQQYVLTLGAWLATQGHEVHYLVGESYRTDIKNVHSLSRNVSVRFNQNCLSIPLPASKAAIGDLLRAENFDVLHVQVPHSPFLAARVVRAASPSTAVVGTFHILPFSRLEKVATHLLGLWLRRNLKRFNLMLAVSEAAAEFAKASFGVQAQVLPNAINISDFKAAANYRNSSQTLTICFLGRLIPRKGALQLLQAVACMPEELRSKLKVRLAGKGPLLGSLEQYVRQNNLVDTVTFEGFIEESKKPAFLASADIAVFPSISGESFGIVLLEAMAAGAGVVVGGDNKGYRTVLGRWPETLGEVRQPQVFADQLARLLTDAALRQRLHDEQQQTVLQYDVQKIGPKLLALYNQALPM